MTTSPLLAIVRLPTIALILFGQVTTTSAEVPEKQRHEVEHLLNFVANTKCMIDRNGSLYNGRGALVHIKKKYAYFRDDITSTKTFIELAASKSTFSGKSYIVRCGKEQMTTTRQWLLNELATYRNRSYRK